MNSRFTVSILLVLLTFFGAAQEAPLEKAIQKGNWLMIFDHRLDTIPPAINDTVRLVKVSKRLKNKVKRPVRFEKSGVIKTPSVCFGCCGTVGRLEALWALKWRDNGDWSITESNDEIFLHYFKFKLKLVESERKEFRFVIVGK